jgi:NAD-dependent DNA ligase
MNTQWQTVSKSPIKYVRALSDADVLALLNQADTAYHNGESVIDDATYDMIVEFIERRMGKKRVTVGADITHGTKVQLPLHMGSMDKVKPDTNKLKNWLKTYTGPYVMSDKLDGISILVEYVGGTLRHIYTRGNGTVGSDVSSLKKYLTLPTLGKRTGRDFFRGELIIAKDDWSVYAKEGYKNPRNAVSGLINRLVSGKRNIPALLKMLHFVVFDHTRQVKKRDPIVTRKLSEGLREALAMGFTVVDHVTVDTIALPQLSDMLVSRREASPYEIDGIIVTNDETYPMKDSGNPDHAVAFKMVLDDQRAETFVQYVEWSISKSGLMKPVVDISPVTIAGTTIHRVTGYNARWIKQNKIGPGAHVVVIKSGDVIPKIIAVTKPAAATQYPNGVEGKDWAWDGDVDIRVRGESDAANIKKLLYFSNTLGIEGLKAGTLKRLYAKGYKTVPKLLRMTQANIETIEGFKAKSAQKLVQHIQGAYHNAAKPVLYAALGVFGEGFGLKKIEVLLKNIPDICTSKTDAAQLKETIVNIDGFGEKTADKIIPNLLRCAGILKSLPKQKPQKRSSAAKKSSVVVKRDVENNTFVFTGVRSKDVEDALRQHGATVSSSVSKRVTLLIAKDPASSSSKVKKAKILNIPIKTLNEFLTWLSTA